MGGFWPYAAGLFMINAITIRQVIQLHIEFLACGATPFITNLHSHGGLLSDFLSQLA
jgi:hypothetical protein